MNFAGARSFGSRAMDCFGFMIRPTEDVVKYFEGEVVSDAVRFKKSTFERPAVPMEVLRRVLRMKTE